MGNYIDGRSSITPEILKKLGFEVHNLEYKHVELEAKGWVLRYLENLNSFFIEPINSPTARIKIESVLKLKFAFIIITDKSLS